MAFPVIEAQLATNTNGAADPQVVDLPTGIVVGELLLAVMMCRNSLVVAGGMPSGWTTIFEDQSTTTFTASPNSTSLCCRVADGTEGASISFDISNSVKGCGMAWRISGAADPATQLPQFSTIADGDGTVVDPGNVNVTGGPKDCLFIWLGTWTGEQTSPPTGNPTNYSNPIGASTGIAGSTASNGRIGAASRQVNASAEDPGTWTISASNTWWAWTIAVHPGAPPKSLITAPRRPERGLVLR